MAEPAEHIPNRDELFDEIVKHMSDTVKGYEIMSVRREAFYIVISLLKAGNVLQLRIGMEGERKALTLEALN